MTRPVSDCLVVNTITESKSKNLDKIIFKFFTSARGSLLKVKTNSLQHTASTSLYKALQFAPY